MAGIGFEIRKIIRRDNLSATLHAYSYAGVISSGPWVLSIIGMLLVGFMATANDVEHIFGQCFTTTVAF